MPSSHHPVSWLAAFSVLIAIALLALINLTDWNWARTPIEHQVGAHTGRQFKIGGNLNVRLGWPQIHISAGNVRFSNPAWATEKNMIEARKVAVDVPVAPLFRRAIVFNDVRLDGAAIFLEQAGDGRKNWLLDRGQRNQDARIKIRHLAVGNGQIEFLDPAQKTRIVAQLETPIPGPGGEAPVTFTAEGQYKGNRLVAEGSGDSVLALRDEKTPYHFKATGRIGPTAVKADGAITNLAKLSVVDVQIALRGGSLAQLFPVLGIVLPDTPPYSTTGRLIHADKLWRYEKFAGRIGSSDIAGSLQVDTGGARPHLAAALHSRRLNFADLGPLVGISGPAADGSGAPAPPDRVLPSQPFRTDRWNRMDADVMLSAQSILRPDALPIDNLSTRLGLHDAVLTLDPLRFGVAGGTLDGTVKLDGAQTPIRAAAALKARKLDLGRLFPAVNLKQAGIGEVNGDVNLRGHGDNVAAMLGSANGELSVVAGSADISKLMMETVSLHLLEMLQLKLSGDQVIRLRCGIAGFEVKDGVMQANTLVVDTDVTRIGGTGSIDLGQEKLDLTVLPKTRKFSLVALRTPIHVTGTFARPQASLDKGKLAARGLGAVALGVINPALSLIPLIEPGPGGKSDCDRLLEQGQPADKVSSR